jgi:hypothetical protein
MGSKEHKMEQSRETDLNTPYVFIDTQSFMENRLDWEAKPLRRLMEFARGGTIKVLTTAVTRAEVNERLVEKLHEAEAALKKVEVVLRQLGITNPQLPSQDVALAKLVERFDEFLSACGAECVPMSIDPQQIINDYFARRPPFGEGKKKAEFPDAFVMQSLLAWCKAHHSSVYIVSRDPDFASCCSLDGPLFHLRSVGEVISLATASEEIRDKFTNFIEDNEEIKETIQAKVRELKLASSWRDDVHLDEVSSGRMHNWEINILDHTGTFLSAGINVDVDISISVTVREEESSYYDERPHLVVRHEHIGTTKTIYIEVESQLDRSEGLFELQSIYVYLDEVEFEFNRGVGRMGRLTS